MAKNEINEKSIVDNVQARVNKLKVEGSINFPPNYSVANALRSAWLIIQETKDKSGKLALSVCTKDSVANALLYTVIQGLNPAKRQIYYIVYGNQLTAQRSYFGTMAVVRRVPGVKDIISDVVWKGDEIETTKEGGSWVILKHTSNIDNIGDSIEDIRAAYCTLVFDGGGTYTEIMSQNQIKKAWGRSKTNMSVHRDFPDQMAKRTVINRACKFFINESDDSDLLIEAFNATGEKYAEPSPEQVTSEVDRLQDLNNEVANDGAQLGLPSERLTVDLSKQTKQIPVQIIAQSSKRGGEENEQFSIDG